MKEINNPKNKEDLYAVLAIKYNVDPDLVEKIVRTQFKFVKDTMEQGEMDSVHLHYFGKFAVKPSRLKYITESGFVPKKKKA